MAVTTEIATLAGGCFWCLEAVFERLTGVFDVTSGYCGGDSPNPSYEQVCSGMTGHAEAVQITFDPTIISYADILKVFFSTHDPTTLNRQGPDVGTQYRSAIFFHTGKQEREGKGVIVDMERQNIWPDGIVTEVIQLKAFYEAEPYHKDYYKQNTYAPYCQFVIAPKLTKLQKEFSTLLQTKNFPT